MSDSTFNLPVALSQVDVMETNKTKHFVKESLKSRIFLGRYIERRLVNVQIGYRDIVLLSAAEIELKKDLLVAQHKLHSVCSRSWIGITDTKALGYKPPGICLWTEIDNQPFGPFWFQIKAIKFRESEVLISLKCLRHITEAFLELEPILTGGSELQKSKDIPENKLSNVVAGNESYTQAVQNLRDALSITNVKEFFTFVFAFVIAVFTGSTSFVHFLGTFVLALIRELSILIKNSTPMLLGMLDFFSKIVGGFYILLAMFFKQSAPVPLDKRYVRQRIENRQRPHTYDDDRYFDNRNFD